MQPEPPPKLNYQPPIAMPRSRGASWGMYFLGLFSGFAVSFAYYVLLGMNVAGHTPIGPLGAVAFKIAVGVALLFVPRWKSFGLGLITSVPIAILIFVSLCFGIIALN
jgi:hypothetical protein